MYKANLFKLLFHLFTYLFIYLFIYLLFNIYIRMAIISKITWKENGVEVTDYVNIRFFG